MAYSKICPIDHVTFVSRKVSAVFCSKKCRNKARSLPESMLISLIQRANQFIIKANNYIAEVPTIDGRIVKIGKDITNQDMRDLELLQQSRKRDKEEKRKLESEQLSLGFGEIISEQQTDIQNTDDDFEDCPDLSNILDSPQQNKPKIRPLMRKE